MTTPYVDPQSLHNPTTGGNPPASWGDAVRDDLEFLIQPPSVQCVRTATLNVTQGTWTTVDFTATDAWDTDGFHDPASNPSRITIPSGLSGKYHIMATILWDADTSATYKQVGLYRNGSLIGDHINGCTSSAWTRQTPQWVVAANAGDYFEIKVASVTGNNVTLVGAGTMYQTFSALWISR